jgi:hypothetical protein
MHLRSKLFVVALIALTASSASAATVTYTLDLSVDNVWKLSAHASAGDNFGIVFYDVPLTGSALTVDNRSPVTTNGNNFAPAGFNLLRAPAPPDGNAGVNPEIRGSQDAVSGPLANLIRGFGQENSNWAAEGIAPLGASDTTHDDVWLTELVLATGTYNRSAGTLDFNTASPNLVANVWAAADGRSAPAATIATVKIPFSGGEVNTPPTVDEEPDESNPNTTQGDIITTTFTATDTTPHPPITFSNAVLSSFVPLFPGVTNPPFNGAVAANGDFIWDTTGFARGTYEIDVTATENFTAPNAGTGGNFVVTIEFVPEPSTLTLFGLAMVGGLGLVRRRNG